MEHNDIDTAISNNCGLMSEMNTCDGKSETKDNEPDKKLPYHEVTANRTPENVFPCEDTGNLRPTPFDKERAFEYLNSLGEADYHSLLRDLLKFRHKCATTFENTNMDPAEANNEITEKSIQKSLQYFQNVQEERVILSISGQEFHTSRVTLRLILTQSWF